MNYIPLPALNRTIPISNRTLNNDNNLLLSTPFKVVKLIYKLRFDGQDPLY